MKTLPPNQKGKTWKQKTPARLKENNPAWKGNNISYSRIHGWLLQTFGKAQECENINCLNRSKVFQWAKLKNKGYRRKRANFIQLCVSCHRIYDMTLELRKKMSNSAKQRWQT